MKHLKKYKVFGSPLMRYLGKEELDDMSEVDIDDYRSEIIQRNRLDDDFNKYYNELELYRELRFDYNMKFLKKLLDNHVPNRRPTSTDDEASDLLVKLINKNGIGFMNDLHRSEYRKKAGDLKFIIGI